MVGDGTALLRRRARERLARSFLAPSARPLPSPAASTVRGMENDQPVEEEDAPPEGALSSRRLGPLTLDTSATAVLFSVEVEHRT